MKVNKLILPLALALVAMIATTGCKKGTPKTTKLFGMRAAQAGDIGPGGTVPGEGGGTGSTTGIVPDGQGRIPAAEGWRVEDMIKDTAALAPYTVHFKYDSYVVQDNEQSKLASVAQALSSDMNAKLLIEGNCDERGTDEYNRTLGEHRALALREALQKNGLDAGRVRTISYGRDKPVDTGHTEAAHAKNRRGDFVLLHPK